MSCKLDKVNFGQISAEIQAIKQTFIAQADAERVIKEVVCGCIKPILVEFLAPLSAVKSAAVVETAPAVEASAADESYDSAAIDEMEFDYNVYDDDDDDNEEDQQDPENYDFSNIKYEGGARLMHWHAGYKKPPKSKSKSKQK